MDCRATEQIKIRRKSRVSYLPARLLTITNDSSTFALQDARKLLNAVAAQVKPIMKKHGIRVTKFEEVS